MTWDILIPWHEPYKRKFEVLSFELNRQITNLNLSDKVKVLDREDEYGNIGKNRNALLDMCTREYLSFVDADDMISCDYIKDNYEAIKLNPDCVSLRGVITWDGSNPELFEHSIKYKAYVTTTNPIKYERMPNHLNAIKSSIAKQFKFPEINHGEDTDWATQIHNSGLLKKEVYIDKVLYHYLYISKK